MNYTSLNVYNFCLSYFDYSSNNGVYVFKKDRFISSVEKTVELLDDYGALDPRCFSWYFMTYKNGKTRDIRYSLELGIDTLRSLDILKQKDKFLDYNKDRVCKHDNCEIEFSLKKYCEKVFSIIKLYNLKFRYESYIKKIEKLPTKEKQKRQNLLNTLQQKVKIFNFNAEELAREIINEELVF